MVIKIIFNQQVLVHLLVAMHMTMKFKHCAFSYPICLVNSVPKLIYYQRNEMTLIYLMLCLIPWR
jgi:hypothetical protein